MFRVEDLDTSVMKLVRQEMTQVLDVVLIERRLSAKVDNLRQLITCNKNDNSKEPEQETKKKMVTISCENKAVELNDRVQGLKSDV